jgi:uncharacterized membrane protein
MSILNTLWGTALATFFLSMVPVLELRFAIPFGVAHDLPLWGSILISVVGNLIPVPFIIIFIQKIFAWLRTKSAGLDRLVSRLEQRAAKKSGVVEQYAFWGLFILVAIPLPGTGAWTGALVAAMLDMRVKRAFPAILLGVIAAGVVVATLTYGAGALLSG